LEREYPAYRAGFVDRVLGAAPGDARNWYRELRRLCREVIEPGAEHIDRSRGYPRTSIAALREIGAFGVVAPRQCGGLGYGDGVGALAVEEVSCACPSTGAILMFHSQVVRRLAMFGNTRRQREQLEQLALGQRMGASAWSETDAGADKRMMATQVVTDGSSWKVQGSKQFITGLEAAELVHVLLRAPGPAGELVPTFLSVEMDTAGLSIEEIYDLVGLRGSSTGSITLDGVAVEPTDVVGEVGWGNKLMSANHTCCIHPGMIALGIARSAYEKLAPWTRGDWPQVRQTTEYQNTRFTLAEIEVQLGSAYAYAAQAIEYAHRDPNGAGVDCVKVKLHASTTGLSVTSAAMRLAGARGFRRDCPFERHWRDSQATLLMGPTNEIVKERVAAQIAQTSSDSE